MILGIGGKMGTTLGECLYKSIEENKLNKKVIGVSRFSNIDKKKQLEEIGIKTISCDLLNIEEVNKLPIVKNIIFMAGKKFGTQGSEEETWAMNNIIPHNVMEHFKESKIVVYSTGCVYELVDGYSGGSVENDKQNPIGDYAISAMGRERVFSYFSMKNKTPISLIRLNYAIDLRYGVLRDIADAVINEEKISLSAPLVNVIWQGDAVIQSLLTLKHTSSFSNIFNITGPETVSIKFIAKKFGELLDKEVEFKDNFGGNCYLSNSSKASELFGYPRVSLMTMIKWIAHWIENNGTSYNKKTHFETTNGKY